MDETTSSCGRETPDEPAELRRKIEELEGVREELLQAERALRESEERYRSLVENLNDVIFNLDPLGRIIYISPALERISSWRPQDLLGKSFTEYVHPDDLPWVLESFKRTLEGALEPIEFRALDRDGGILNVRTSSRPLTKDGELVGLTGILTEIGQRKEAEETLTRYREDLEKLVEERTAALRESYLKLQYETAERKRKEEQLARSEKYWRALVENSFDIIAVLDADGTTRYLSPSSERTSGYDNRETVGRNAFDFFHPDDLAASAEAFRRAVENPGFSERVEYRWRHKDGSWHTMESVASNLLDDPDVRGIVVNSRDITERKRAEERLERMVRCFLDLGPDPLTNIERIVTAAREIPGGKLAQYGRRQKGETIILSCLAGAEGCSRPEEPGGHVCSNILDAGLSEPLVLDDMRGSDLCEGTEELRRGLESCLALPVFVRRELRGCLCIFDPEAGSFRRENIDILRTLAMAIANEEERWSYEEYLRDFIDIASHELRHPLSLVTGFVETLDSPLADEDKITRKEIIEAIKVGADRLERLAAGLANISLLERDRFTVVKEKVDVGSLIGQVVSEMAVRAPRRDFRVRVDEGVGEYELDLDRFRDLLIILLENAVKYSGEDTPVEVSAGTSGESIEIAVADRGIGVPEEHREKIFDRFHQVVETRYHSKPGLGLGLYLAREIAASHGGTIRHEPREGGGSIFRVTLPL